MRRWLRALGRAALLGAAGLALGAGWLYATSDVDRARFVRPEDAVTVLDRSGEPLRHHRPEQHDRRWVALDAISPHLIDAVIAVEDDRFYAHHGVDARASARAALTFALPGRRMSGASTITQQVVKLVYGRPGGLWDKPREMARALRLEQRFDKAWILEQYLNRLPYGDQVVGVARASELYFGVPASELSLGQAALLAGIPQAPSALDPRRHLSRALRRRRVVLARMRQTGRIDAATERQVADEPVAILQQPVRPWRAPRFVDASLEAWRRGELTQRGGRIRTSLDLPTQREAGRIVRGAVRRHAGAGVTNGAAVVIANATGEVLAYVGAARTEEGAPGAWLDLAAARRQPGSTLKPFVYELFFEEGGTAATLLDDIHRPMVGGRGELFEARDYDGRTQGPVRARAALASSLNLAALDAARQVGAHAIVRRLRALGVSGLDEADRYGAAIVLGGADVSALELAGAYATLARGGARLPPRFAPGAAGEPVRVMEPAAAAIARDVLRDPAARREAFGDDLSALFGDAPFGLKTGTSSGWHDAWTAVFTDELTVVVWLGDPENRPLGAVNGFGGAARPAVRILAAAHARLPSLGLPERPVEAPPLAQARICAATGRLAGPRCTHTLEERFAPGTLPARVCDAHRDDGRVTLPPRYARWLREEHPAGFALAELDRSSGSPEVAHPRDGARLLLRSDRDAIPLRATLGGHPVEARWEVDGVPLEGDSWRPTEGGHTLLARLDGRASAPIEVDVHLAP